MRSSGPPRHLANEKSSMRIYMSMTKVEEENGVYTFCFVNNYIILTLFLFFEQTIMENSIV